MIRSTSRIPGIYDNRVEISLAVWPGLEGPIPRTDKLRRRKATTTKIDRRDRVIGWQTTVVCLWGHP